MNVITIETVKHYDLTGFFVWIFSKSEILTLMENLHKIFGKIDLFDFITSFFWTGLFKIFWPAVYSQLHSTYQSL